MNKFLLVGVVILLNAFSSQSFARVCDMHGGPGFGRFAHAQQNFDPNQRKFFSAIKMSLRHTRKLESEVNKDASVLVKYRVPGLFKDVSINFVASSGLDLKIANSLMIDDVIGEFELPFTALEQGQHRIEITVDAVKSGSPVSLVQLIDVVAI